MGDYRTTENMRIGDEVAFTWKATSETKSGSIRQIMDSGTLLIQTAVEPGYLIDVSAVEEHQPADVLKP